MQFAVPNNRITCDQLASAAREARVQPLCCSRHGPAHGPKMECLFQNAQAGHSDVQHHWQYHLHRQLHRHSRPAPGQSCSSMSATAIAAQTAIPAVPVFLGLSVAVSSLYTFGCFLAMILQPQKVRDAVQSHAMFLPLALLYAILLAQSWTPDTLSILLPGSLAEGLSGGFKPQFFPRLAGICTLFSQIPTAPSVLVHIMTINLLMGRVAFLEGLRLRVPFVHTLLVSMVCGPLGLLCHYLTQAIVTAVPSLRRRDEAVVLYNDWGKITLDPY